MAYEIFVRGQRTYTVEVREDTDVLSTKERLAREEGATPDDVVLYHGGRPLEDAQLLSGLLPHTTLDLEVRLLGGKVHGSLARAGKVKGQTPKVEAGEKKKKKTGRAKRRLQYNRRFVNVVQTFGRKKGPNSNS